MARLSVEHYRASANMRPDPTRNSSRIRDMFRARSSYSLSMSSFQPQPLPQSSPNPTPTVKIGFEQVGLLPGERHSNNEAPYESVPTPASYSCATMDYPLLQANNLNYELQRAAEQPVNEATVTSLLDGASASLDTLLAERAAYGAQIRNDELEAKRKSPVMIGKVSESALAERRANQQQIAVCTVDKAVRQSSRPHSMDVMSTLKEQEAGAFANTPSNGVLNGIRCEALRRASSLNPNTKNKKRFRSSGAGIPASPRDTVQNDEHDESVYENSDNQSQDSNRKSFASNIFDDNDSLSQGIREYVASKITEALLEHDRKLVRESGEVERTETVENMVSDGAALLNITINFDLLNLAKLKRACGATHAAPLPGALKGPKRLDPLIIKPSIATKLQSGVIVIYGMLLVAAAVVGPAAFFLMLWRLASFLLIQLFVVSRVLACDEWSSDVGLAPAFYLYHASLRLLKQCGALLAQRLAGNLSGQ